MKKRRLLIFIILSSLLIVGCSKEVEDAELVELPYEEHRIKSIEIEELGDYTLVREVEVENVFAENESIKMTVTDYKLSTLKPKDEYIEFFMELETGDLDEIAILDISLIVENLSDNIFQTDYLGATLITNTGEEVPINLEFFDGKYEEAFKFSGKEVKKGSSSAILSSNVEDIESFELVYDDLKLNFK